jgi:hypothetical protein
MPERLSTTFSSSVSAPTSSLKTPMNSRASLPYGELGAVVPSFKIARYRS